MRKSAAFAAVLLAACNASSPPAIRVEDAWARSTAPGQSSAAAYFTLHNTGGGDRLVSVSSRAGEASLHSSSMNDGIMRMRPIKELDVPADSTVKLEPGGTHVMIMELKAPLAAGSTFPLDLHFDTSGERQVTVSVRPATGGGAPM